MNARTRLAQVLSRERALPEGFRRQRDDTVVVLITEPVLADDGLVLVGPWKLERYERNPVVLWCHNRYEPGRAPIGRALQVVETEPGVVYAELEFDLGDPLGAEVNRKYHAGFLHAVSVRWESDRVVHASKLGDQDPLYGEDLYVGIGNDLVEISAVPIGALASAVAQRSADEVLADVDTLLRVHPELRPRVEARILALPAPTSSRPDPDSLDDWFTPAPPTQE